MNSSLITGLYYSHESLPLFLCHEKSRSLAGDLLVELTTSPSLAYHIGLETPRGYPGLAGLLSGIQLEDLQRSVDKLPAPAVLAPGTPVAPGLLREALQRLRSLPGAPEKITILVPMAIVPSFGACLTLLDQHAITWDISAPPHPEMLAAVETLAAEELLEESSFVGVFPYSSAVATGEYADAHRRQILELVGKMLPASAAHELVNLHPAA